MIHFRQRLASEVAWYREDDRTRIAHLLRSVNIIDRAETKAVEASKYNTPQRPVAPDIGNLGKHREHGVVWICGDYAEIIFSASSSISGVSPEPQTERCLTAEEIEKKRESSYWRAAYRAQKNVRRLCNANRCRYMWTFTFAPPSDTNDKKYNTVSIDRQRDYAEVTTLWKYFLRRLRRTAYANIRWIVVFELHDSDKTSDLKRGTWHCHLATPDYIDYHVLQACWGHGGITVDDFNKPKKGVRSDSVRNPGAYISKYIGKSFDEHTAHLKRYRCSRNVTRPLKISPETFADSYVNDNLEEVYRQTHQYTTKEGASYYRVSVTLYNKTT